MSRAELDRLVGSLQRDPDLLAEFRRLEGDPRAVVDWANGKGYAFTRAEVETFAAASGEISDDDLDQVAGGWTGTTPPPPSGSGGP
ncbi:MAG: Nif11-like leader peptide family natural product precursor [Acidobacteriota bacterium]|nr:Nif11-like leader peptide family natural product precursor [Acidobacteriota bacterium]